MAGHGQHLFKAQGIEVGRSLAEDDLLDEARRLLIKAESKGTALMLPEDVLIAAQIAADAAVQTVDVKDVPSDMMILDIGPKTVLKYQEAIATARTIIWNGPLGVYEYEPFSHGTREVARGGQLISPERHRGGDSVAAVHDLGVEKASPIFPPAEGPAWSSWKAGNCPEWLFVRPCPLPEPFEGDAIE